MPRGKAAVRRLVAVGIAVAAPVLGGCVTLNLKEATRPYLGRTWPDAPTIAVCEVRDRRDDPERFGRVGWNVFSISGDAGVKFRNALMTALNDAGYNLRFVGPINVLDRDAVARAVGDAGADVLLTAAVLELRVYSTDPFFDPADVDFVAQVNLLDPEGRTVYTRHVHSHDDKRLWFNAAFGALGMLDNTMEAAAAYIAKDDDLKQVVAWVRKRHAPLPPLSTLTPGEKVVLPAWKEGQEGETGGAP
jgi:hypothetical protein